MTEYPLQVTKALPLGELAGWIIHFAGKNIGITVKPVGKYYTLWRELTQENIRDIEWGDTKIKKNWLYMEKE